MVPPKKGRKPREYWWYYAKNEARLRKKHPSWFKDDK